jgi:hypothetical protein
LFIVGEADALTAELHEAESEANVIKQLLIQVNDLEILPLVFFLLDYVKSVYFVRSLSLVVPCNHSDKSFILAFLN